MNDTIRLAANEAVKQAQLDEMQRARERRAKAYGLRKSGKKFEEIALELGVSRQRAATLVHDYVKKDKRFARFLAKNGG